MTNWELVKAVERRFDRRAARRYWHMTPWRSCTSAMGGVCLRCLWRDLTGIHRRERRAFVERSRSRRNQRK